ncbi:hypothetical protein RB2262 [Rhodopirellula baltica SH 1]|uniref:Uncharacterized protein n=1 Tax=Rhodopirellula baltica (strain DSM 10527 / NCIMB 13988 / SH1) TaxID=243090 RepID=Q7UW52_RHOBA|nr:hypothetical protein RB2262 [Rhodopirellula baltica SH 1]
MATSEVSHLPFRWRIGGEVSGSDRLINRHRQCQITDQISKYTGDLADRVLNASQISQLRWTR